MSTSSTRDEETEVTCEWKQRRELTGSDTKSESQPRRNMQTTSAFPQHKQTTTATHVKQYLQHRSSQHEDDKCDEQQLQSLKTNGSSDSDALVPLILNSYETDVDTTVETMTEDVVATVSGKGIITTRRTIGRDQNVVAKVTMAKKRKAPYGRLTGVLVVIVVGVVAGGVVVCQIYPSSPVVASIRDAAGGVEEVLFTLLANLWNEVEPYTKQLGEVLHAKWLALLRSRRLGKAARTMEAQALQGISGFMQPREVATVCFRLIEGLRDQLRLALSGLFDLLAPWMEWVHSVFMKLTRDGKLFEQVQALLLTALSSLAKALRQSGELMASSLGKVLEWIGMEPEMSDVNVPGEHFLAPLVTHQAAIQNIGKGLTAQEFGAVHDVKRFEKRRVIIASATNSIIEDTRAIALESVVDVKMAAVEFIEDRTRQLAEQYARAFEQALEDYERTSWQAEEEGGSEMLAEITTESQAQVDAAASLKRYLSVHEKAVDKKLMETSVLEDQTLLKDEVRDDRATGYHLVGSQLAEESKLSGGLTEFPVLKEQSSAEGMSDSNLDNKGESHILVEIVSGGLMTVELTEAPAMEHNSPEEASESELVSEEQDHVLSVELSEVSVVVKSSEKAVGGDHVAEDQLQIIAKHTEIDLSVALESTDRNEVIDEVEQTFTTQVLVDFDNTLLEVELMQAEVSRLVDVRNLSEEEAQLQQESQVEAHLKAQVDGNDAKLVEELTAISDKSFEEEEVEQPFADVRTRIAAQPGIETEGNMEKGIMERTKSMQDAHEETLPAGDKEIVARSEHLVAGSVLKVQVDADGVEVFTKFQHTEEESAGIHSHDEAVVEIQKGPVGVANDVQRERTGFLEIDENDNAATLIDVKILESERVVAAKEIKELEQLEQILLQEEDERFRVVEELRVIADEERIWLQTDQAPGECDISQKDAVSGQCRTDVLERAEAVADSKTEDWQTSPGDTLLVLPRPAMMQIGLFSMAFLGLAALALYLFVRHHKRGFLTRAPRRRKRWQRLADMDESEAEEVVLLPDDSSDEEDDTDVAVVKQSSLKVIEQMANVEVEEIEVISSGGEEDGEQGE